MGIKTSEDLIKRSDAITAVAQLCAWHGSEGAWVLQEDVIEALENVTPNEPNSSEKPNNSTISKMEQVEDEPKTQMKTQNSNLTFEKADEPQTEDEILREQCRAFMGIVEQTKRGK